LPSAHLLAPAEWTRARRRLAVALSVFFVGLFLAGIIAMAGRFPHASYAWTELLLSYRGGFMRRGLLGEIAFSLRDVIEPRLLLGVLVWLAYAFVALWFVRLVCSRLSLGGLMFLLSPALLLLPAYDFEAFGRKDIFIVGAFCLSVELVRRVGNERAAGAGILLVFAVAGLVHELAFFYLPLAMLLLAAREFPMRGRAWAFRLGSVTAVFVAVGIALSVVFKGDAHHAADIVASWRELYPDIFSIFPGAVHFLDFSLADNLAQQTQFLGTPQTWGGYLIACALMLLPFGLLLPGRSLGRHFADPLLRAGLVAALLMALFPFVLAGDWGRIIAIFGLVLGAFLLPLRSAADEAQLESWWNKGGQPTLAVAGLVLFYALSWRMRHSAPGSSSLVPGTLFLLFPGGD